MSLGKVFGAMYIVIGIAFSIIFTLVISLPAAIGETTDSAFAGIRLFIMPFALTLGYAIAGFIAGILTAFLYNFVSKWCGGIEIELK